MSDIMEESTSNRGNEGLKALREKAGLNRTQMAKAVGVSPRMWQRYENEGRLPEKIDFVVKIAVLADTPVEEVLKLVGFKFPSKDDLLSETKDAESQTV
jgi:transcriptional regulator with XRE-family HTH domain